VVRRQRGITTLDVAVIALILTILAYLVYRTTVVIHYHWNWSVIPQYMFRFDEERGRWVVNLLMQGFITTIKLSLWTTFLALILGTVMGFFRISTSLFKRLTARSYVELIRNVPPLVLIFIFYFFLSDQIMTVLGVEDFILSLSDRTRKILAFFMASPGQFSAFLSAVITLVLYEGAYMTEIIRAGIQSIEKGQWEASSASGLSWWQQMRFVILPQAIRRILPPIAGQLISTIKDSAIVSVVSVQELTFQGLELMSATYLTFEVWITITVLYFILTFSCSLGIRRLEVSLNIEGTSFRASW
jgi:polar amino acid transport system permease protein